MTSFYIFLYLSFDLYGILSLSTIRVQNQVLYENQYVLYKVKRNNFIYLQLLLEWKYRASVHHRSLPNLYLRFKLFCVKYLEVGNNCS